MEARYEAASPDAPTYKMQIARDKDGIWITVSKSGILPRCASTMGNARDDERNVARSRLRVRADLDETGGGLAPRREKGRRRKDPRSCAHTKSPLAARESRGISGNRHRGWVSVSDNRGTVTILYRREIRPADLTCVYVRTRAEDEIVILIVLVTGNRFSRARDSIARLFGYTSAMGRLPYMRRPYGKNRPVTSLIHLLLLATLGY